MTTRLSVIVIARNEEARIGACLEACLASIDRARQESLMNDAEVILVDSASTDLTIQTAMRYPVSIVQLPPTWPLSAAAGKHVGLRHVRGDIVQFVDGDYVLSVDWLPEALRELEGDSSLAAVCGRDVEELTGPSTLLDFQREQLLTASSEPEAVPIGLFRRDALESVGGIHPFLKGAEDRDVVVRLRSGGFRIKRMNRTMGTHYWMDRGPLDFITYFRSVFTWSFGDGQLARVRRREKALHREIRRRYANARLAWNYLLSIALVSTLFLHILASLFFTVPLFSTVVAVDLAFLLVLLVRRSRAEGSWRRAVFGLHVVPYTIIRHGGFLLGWLTRTPTQELYPTGETVIPPRSPPSP